MGQASKELKMIEACFAAHISSNALLTISYHKTSKTCIDLC